jgi:hypothetical protein
MIAPIGKAARLRGALFALVVGGTLIAVNAQAQAHEFTVESLGTGYSASHATSDAELHYRLNWHCPRRYSIVTLTFQVHQRFSWGGGEHWFWANRETLVNHTGDNAYEGERQGAYRMRHRPEHENAWRLRVEAPDRCSWHLHATWHHEPPSP